jgi:glycerol dehydrogenase
MTQRFIAPASYVQGRGVLASAGEYVKTLSGETAYALGGSTALSVAEDDLRAGFEGDLEIADVGRGVDACTRAAIDAHAEAAEAVGADTIVGVGGGVALDTSKAVAMAVGAESVIVPTVASTDAPTSTVAVVYDEDGGFEESIFRERNPELVLVDTELIARAPTRFLRYGMGDAFATKFEAEATAEARGETTAGELPADAALAIADEAYRRLREDGPAALAAADRDAVTPAFERIVEANTLLSGLGFESGGVAAAHAIYNAFTRAGIDEPHGLLVGFGTIAELVLEGREAAVVDEAVATASKLGLDPSLADVGAADRVDAVAEHAVADGLMANEPFDPDPAAVADAIRTADELLAAEEQGLNKA